MIRSSKTSLSIALTKQRTTSKYSSISASLDAFQSSYHHLQSRRFFATSFQSKTATFRPFTNRSVGAAVLFVGLGVGGGIALQRLFSRVGEDLVQQIAFCADNSDISDNSSGTRSDNRRSDSDDLSSGSSILQRDTTEAHLALAVEEVISAPTANRCSKLALNPYRRFRILSPAGRRHIIRVYRLLLNSLVCCLAGFGCGLSTFVTRLVEGRGEGESGALVSASASGFSIPAFIINVFMNRSSSSSASMLPLLLLPMWTPFAAVFLGMVGLALSSRALLEKGDGEELVEGRLKEGEEGASAVHSDLVSPPSPASPPSTSLARHAAVRRAILYALSFAEGMALVPLAKALCLTHLALAALLVSCAVVASFAAVAMHKGGYAYESSKEAASMLTMRAEEGEGEEAADGTAKEALRSDVISMQNEDEAIRADAPSNVNLHQHAEHIEERRELVSASGTRALGGDMSASRYAKMAPLAETSLLIEGLLYSNAFAAAGLSVLKSFVGCGVASSSSASSRQPPSSADDASISAAVGSALVASSPALFVSPLVVAAIALFVSVALAMDTSELLDHYELTYQQQQIGNTGAGPNGGGAMTCAHTAVGNNSNKNKRASATRPPPHISSFFILDSFDQAEGDEKDDLSTDIVNAVSGYVISAVSLLVKAADVILEVDWRS